MLAVGTPSAIVLFGNSGWGEARREVTDGRFGTIEVTAAATACLPPCTECSCRSELIRITVGKAKLASFFGWESASLRSKQGTTKEEKSFRKKCTSLDLNSFVFLSCCFVILLLILCCFCCYYFYC